MWLLLLALLSAPFVGLAVSLGNRRRIHILEHRLRALEQAGDVRDFARRDTSATSYALGVMGIGIQRREAAPRFGAMALFGVVLLKVFVVDLGRLDAGYRILSFLVLGAVLIFASFMYTRFRERIVGRTS